MSKQGDVYCTGRLQQLNVVLPLISQEDVDLWSGTEIGVSITGVRDVFGNLHGKTGTGDIDAPPSNLRRGLESQENIDSKEEVSLTIPMNFTLPMIPNLDGTERKWEMPSDENMISMVNKERDRILPRGFVLSSSHLSDSKPKTSSSSSEGFQKIGVGHAFLAAGAAAFLHAW